MGQLRQDHSVGAYRISKYPVSWDQFEACVASQQCAPADTSECQAAAYAPYPGRPGDPNARTAPYDARAGSIPATCVGQEQAEAYCKWVGGRLPTLDEWFSAARGPSPTRFSWGDKPAGCDQHPIASISHIAVLDAGAGCPGITADSSGRLDPASLTVGKHPLGASPAGLQDVLLMPGELLASDANAQFNACIGSGTHCVVAGISPGAIDTVEPFYPQSEQSSGDGTSASAPRSVVRHAYGFRCVVGAGQ